MREIRDETLDKAISLGYTFYFKCLQLFHSNSESQRWMQKWCMVIHYHQETWRTHSPTHHCWSSASRNRGLLSELERVPAVRIQWRLGNRPLTPVRWNWLVWREKKVREGLSGALVVKPYLEAETLPWGSFTEGNLTWHSWKMCLTTTCIVSAVLAQGYNNVLLTNVKETTQR